MANRIPLHLLLMGETKAGKDTFAATWPKPMMVWHMDGHGQDAPYMKGAQNVGELQYYQMDAYTIEYRDIIAADGGVIRIEYYSSENPTYPQVSQVLERRMGAFYNEQAGWQTLVVGSLSSASLEARLTEQFVMNPQYKDPRKWYGSATEYVERLIFMQKALKCNTIFICHLNRDKDEVGGEYLFGPDLPGRLSYGAGRYFSEMYRLYIQRDEQGVAHRVLQTDGDGRFQCGNHIEAPNPCYPAYESLWANWDRM